MPQLVVYQAVKEEPSLSALSVRLVEVLLATMRDGGSLQEHGDWPLLEDCWALAAGRAAPHGRTEEQARIEVEEEIKHYSFLK